MERLLMKRLLLAFAFSACAAASASAQGVSVGPRGVEIDPGVGRPGYAERRWERERRYGAYEDGYGRGGCRTITIRSEDPYGNERVKRIRRCG
jgi:hypothetical protein